MACDICFEEDVTTYTSSLCPHSYCQPCWVKWLESAEQRRHGHEAICPTCRVAVPSRVSTYLLGRPFQPREASASCWVGDGGSDEPIVDDFTMSTLESIGAKQCPHCQVWIVKEEGCCAMQCICGQRFCWTCGSATGCIHVSSCHFFNNVVGQEMDLQTSSEPAPLELLEDLPNYLRRTRNAEHYAAVYRQFHRRLKKEHGDRFRLWNDPYGPPSSSLLAFLRATRASRKQQEAARARARVFRLCFGEALSVLARQAFVDALSPQTNSRCFRLHQDWLEKRQRETQDRLFWYKEQRSRSLLSPGLPPSPPHGNIGGTAALGFGVELDELAKEAFGLLVGDHWSCNEDGESVFVPLSCRDDDGLFWSDEDDESNMRCGHFQEDAAVVYWAGGVGTTLDGDETETSPLRKRRRY